MAMTTTMPPSPAASQIGLNLHIVRNPVSYDSRVLKETATLRDLGRFAAVEIAGFHEHGYTEHEDLDGRALWRVILASRRLPKNLAGQAIKFAEWRHHLVAHYRNRPLAVIHCHDLDPLPIAVRLKRLTGAHLVYDAHELETEQSATWSLRKGLMRRTERRCMPWVDAMITVSPSIRDWYMRTYPGLAISLVRNVPERPPDPIGPANLRDRLGVPNDALLFLYLGGLAGGRGIENMLAAFAAPGIVHHLLVLGNGPLRGAVELACARCSRLHYLPAVPPDKVLAHAAGADVGISMAEDTCLNNRYCLPNKLFESLIVGLPMLVSDLPDQRHLVESYRAGWTCTPDVTSIVAALTAIDRGGWTAVRTSLAERTRELGWHHEAAILTELYDSLLLGQAPGDRP